MKPGSPSFSFAKTFLEWNALRHSHATLVHSVQILCTQSELALPFCKGFPGMVSLNSSEVTSWMNIIDCFGILFKIEHFRDFLALVHKCPFAKVVCIQIQLTQRLPPDKIELLQDILTCTIGSTSLVPTCIGTTIRVKIPRESLMGFNHWHLISVIYVHCFS